MKAHDFRKLISRLDDLTPGQVQFLEVIKDMLGPRAPSSIRQLSRRLNKDKYTIWRSPEALNQWRLFRLTV